MFIFAFSIALALITKDHLSRLAFPPYRFIDLQDLCLIDSLTGRGRCDHLHFLILVQFHRSSPLAELIKHQLAGDLRAGVDQKKPAILSADHSAGTHDPVHLIEVPLCLSLSLIAIACISSKHQSYLWLASLIFKVPSVALMNQKACWTRKLLTDCGLSDLHARLRSTVFNG